MLCLPALQSDFCFIWYVRWEQLSLQIYSQKMSLTGKSIIAGLAGTFQWILEWVLNLTSALNPWWIRSILKIALVWKPNERPPQGRKVSKFFGLFQRAVLHVGLTDAPGASDFNFSSLWLSVLQRESWTMLGIQVPWILYHWMVITATATAWPAPITWATACKSSTARTTYTKRPRWRNGSWKSSPPTTCPLTWTTTTARPSTDATSWTSWLMKSATEAGWRTRPCCPSISRWAWTTLRLSRTRTVWGWSWSGRSPTYPCFRRHATSSLFPPPLARPLHRDDAFHKKTARVSSLCLQRSKRKRLRPRRETRSTPACPRCPTPSAPSIRCLAAVTRTRSPEAASRTKCIIRACPTWAHATICTSCIATTSWVAAAATALSSRPKMSFHPKKRRRKPHIWSPAYRGHQTPLCSHR